MLRGTKTFICGLVCASALTGSAVAGGFDRGDANLEGLYGDGMGIYSGVTFVAPGRSYQNINGTLGPSPDQTFTNSYTVPYLSAGGRLVGDLNCVGSYSQPFGADAEYSGALRFDKAYNNFTVDEYGLTCSYGADVGPGRAYFIGGGFYTTLDYNEAQDLTLYPLLDPYVDGISSLNLKGEAWGYRIGVAYEIPKIAMRASLIYRSQTDYNTTGMYSNVPFSAISGHPEIYGLNYAAGASASASLPQSLELNLRSGIRPGWLAFASVKWTDWSVLQTLSVTESIGGSDWSTSDFKFTDGWTVTGGIAHLFTDELAGSVSVTWDKGVTGGYDTLTDSWAFASGLRYAKDNFEVSAGGAAIYFTKGVKSEGDYTATSPAEWGYALSVSGSIKF